MKYNIVTFLICSILGISGVCAQQKALVGYCPSVIPIDYTSWRTTTCAGITFFANEGSHKVVTSPDSIDILQTAPLGKDTLVIDLSNMVRVGQGCFFRCLGTTTMTESEKTINDSVKKKIGDKSSVYYLPVSSLKSWVERKKAQKAVILVLYKSKC